MKEENDRKENMFDENIEQNGTFAKTIKKAQRKTILRNVFISLTISFLLFIGLFVIWQNIMRTHEDSAIRGITIYNQLTTPNIHTAGYQSYFNGLFQGFITFEQYKIIDGKPVDWGEQIYVYNLMGDVHRLAGDHSPIQLEQEQNDRRYDRNTKQLIMEFYHPEVKYESIKNDISRMKNMPDTVSAELAISFTDKLSPEQVRDMLPKDVSLQWYWVDTYETNDQMQPVIDSGLPIQANDPNIFGFEHREDVHGEKLFINWLKEGVSFEEGAYYGEIKLAYDNIKDENKELKTDQVKVLGAVVSGKPENLMKVKNIPQVRTSVLGAVTNNY